MREREGEREGAREREFIDKGNKSAIYFVVHSKELTELEVETLRENLSTAHKRIEHLTEVRNI